MPLVLGTSDNGHYVTSARLVFIAARASLDQNHLDEVLVNTWLTLKRIVLSVPKLLRHYT